MKRSRALISLVPIALTAALLTSCSSGDNADENGGDTGDSAAMVCMPDGEVTRTIEIEGQFGGTVTIASETPVVVTEMQRSVIVEGNGRELSDGDQIRSQLTIFNGTSGEQLSTEPAGFMIDSAQLNPWAYQAVSCASIGDRVVMAATATEILGEGNATTMGLEDSDTIVIVFDMLGAQPGTLDASELLPKAEGEAQAAPAGFPTVELDADGAPTITMPDGVDAPSSLSIATLIKGSGEEVLPGDRVYVHYRGVIWRTGEEFDSSWSRGEPTAFTTDGVIRGFQEALVGQTVGSQIISVVPAEDGGYGGASLEGMGHQADDVMVFVLDILGVAHAE